MKNEQRDSHIEKLATEGDGEGCGCAPTCCAKESDVVVTENRENCGCDDSCCEDAPATESAIRELVRKGYGAIAKGGGGCCGERTAASAYCGIGESYAQMEGYLVDADLGLGCGIPTEHAGLSCGMTVLDLGSGAGNDVFVARREVGESGRVIGVDFTPEMVAKANVNKAKAGYENVEFREGDIEALPVAAGTIDVVISNCVLNLVPNKRKAFAEIFRVLKPGGHFCVSDVVIEGELPAGLRKTAELYVGCVAGALERHTYLQKVKEAGFDGIEVVKEREITLPENLLREYLDEETLAAARAAGVRVVSVTVKAWKRG